MTKILIVEDDTELSETYSDMLQSAGYSVETCSSGSNAVYMLPMVKPDVVVLDMQLPGTSGEVVLSFIRGHQRLKETKVLVVSGYLEEDRPIRGADLYLHKPVELGQLRQSIAQLSEGQA